MNTKALYQLLRQRRYADLERFFSSAQATYEAGHLDEEKLSDIYAKLCFDSLPSVKWLQEWQSAMPQSYPANFILAQWYQGAGWDARGADTASNVSEAGWQGMFDWHQQAARLAQASLALTAKPIFSYCVLGNISRGAGHEIDPKKSKFPDWYTQGLAVAPDSTGLRIQLMQLIRPEWGGSKRLLSDFVEVHREHACYAKIESARHRFLLHYAAYFDRNWDQVEKHLAEAKRLDPNNVWIDYWYALALCNFGRMDEANTLLRDAIVRAPDERELVFQLTEQLAAQNTGDELSQAARSALDEQIIQALKPLVINGDARAIERTANRLMDQAEAQNDKRLAQEAKEYYEYLWEGGHHQAGNRLANLYVNGTLVAKDVKRAFAYAKESADLGNEYSSQLIWNSFEAGDFTSMIDTQGALNYLSRARRLGNPYAFNRIIEAIEKARCTMDANQQLHAHPSGTVTRDALAQAFALRRDAALDGDLIQQKHLAKLMMEGNEYFPPDKVAGLQWFEMAAENGDDYAQVMLGWYYARGEHCELNYEKALPWLEMALEQDNKFAYYELGRLCLDGLGLPRDLARATQLLEIAALQHKRQAAFELLASRYFYGKGFAQDHAKARYWMEQARANDCSSAWMDHQLSVFEATGLSRLLKRFTPIDKANLIEAIG